MGRVRNNGQQLIRQPRATRVAHRRVAHRRKRHAEAREVRGRNKHYAAVARCRRIVQLASDGFERRCVRLVEEMNNLRQSDEFARLVKLAADLGETKRALYLPALYVDRDNLRAVFGQELLHQGQPLGIDENTWFVWSIGRRLRLHRHHYHKYFPGFSRRLVNVKNINELPSLRSRLAPLSSKYTGVSAKEQRLRDKLEPKAQAAICAVKLLDVVERGSLLDLLAERLQCRVQEHKATA